MKKHCLALEGLQFHANHGYYQSETEKGGDYIVDIYLHLDLEPAGKSDDLEQTVNYESIYSIVSEVMTSPKKLIETVAFAIQNKIIEIHPEVDSFTVKVRKINPPLKGKVNESFVEFSYTNDDINTTSVDQNTKSSYWEERGKY